MFFDGLSLMNCGISFQKKFPIQWGKISEDQFEMRVLQLGWMMHCGYCNYVAQILMKQAYQETFHGENNHKKAYMC